MYMCMMLCWETYAGHREYEDNFVESVPSFHIYVSSGVWTQVIKLVTESSH